MSPEQARGEEAGPQSRSLRARRPLLRDAHRAAPVPLERSRHAARDAAHARRRRKPRAIRPDVHPQAEAIVAAAPREGRAQALPGRPPSPRRAEGAPALAAVAAVGRRAAPATRRPRRRRRRRRSRRASSSGRAAPRSSRAWCARAYPSGNAPPEVQTALAQAWDLAARAQRASRARSRATRASSRRSSAAAARSAPKSAARSKSSRTKSRARCARRPPSSEEAEKAARRARAAAETRGADRRKAQADAAERAGADDARRSSSARAPPPRCSRRKREWLQKREAKKAAREGDRRAICAVRSTSSARSSSRYAEALEEDLASGREKVAARTREGLNFEKAFSDVTSTLVQSPQGEARMPRPAHRAHQLDELGEPSREPGRTSRRPESHSSGLTGASARERCSR